MAFSGIHKIYFCSASDIYIPNKIIPNESSNVECQSDWQEICIYGERSVEENAELLNGQYVYEMALSFFTRDIIANLPDDAVFMIVDVDRRSWLFGWNEKPYPTINRKFENGIITKRRGYYYTISYRNIFGLVELFA